MTTRRTILRAAIMAALAALLLGVSVGGEAGPAPTGGFSAADACPLTWAARAGMPTPRGYLAAAALSHGRVLAIREV